ncbi:helix-turn-helix domain-containing protein [Nocardia sp. NPDC049737]|uniref:helix-turn-helix domain-containing protein n=1 Tax=Nocardia sp. NPDC049737 TaxID=3154358 RepID=UPI003449BCCD
MRRAIVVIASAQRQPVPMIAKLMQVSESYVRHLIHDFNEKVFDALNPKWSGGRQVKTDQAMRDRIGQIARCCPRNLGWPFLVWSLSKLADVLRTNQVADLSRETLRQILKAGGCRGRPPRRARPATIPNSRPRWRVCSISTTTRPATAGWCARTSSGPLNLR